MHTKLWSVSRCCWPQYLVDLLDLTAQERSPHIAWAQRKDRFFL
jgi:hypothetical protein